MPAYDRFECSSRPSFWAMKQKDEYYRNGCNGYGNTCAICEQRIERGEAAEYVDGDWIHKWCVYDG